MKKLTFRELISKVVITPGNSLNQKLLKNLPATVTIKVKGGKQ